MAKKILFLTTFILSLFLSAAMAAEEVRLSTILPVTGLIRGARGAIGAHYRDRANLADNAIEDGHLYIERGLDIGQMYDNANPAHGTYIRNHVPAALLRIGTWGDNYADGTISGVCGGIALGNGNIHSFEHLYMSLGQNLIWSATDVKRISDGPGSFMLIGRTWGPTDEPGLYFRLAPVGLAGSDASQGCETLRIMPTRTEVWTFAAGSFTRGTGQGLYVNNIRVGAPSDINLKKDISNLPPVLDRIDTIRGVNFKWKDDGDTLTHAGVIAQEVEKRFQELVQVNPAGIKYVSYEGLDGVLVEAVKELKKKGKELRLRNESMKKTAEELKKENELLEARIRRLENRN